VTPTKRRHERRKRRGRATNRQAKPASRASIATIIASTVTTNPAILGAKAKRKAVDAAAVVEVVAVAKVKKRAEQS